MSSLRILICSRRWQQSTVAEESTKEAVNTIARGMPVDCGVPVVTNSCVFYFSHARLWVRTAHPAFPPPSFQPEDVLPVKPGRGQPREGEVVRAVVLCIMLRDPRTVMPGLE